MTQLSFQAARCLRQWLGGLALAPLLAAADLPSSGKFTAAPDEWLLGNGQSWHYQTTTASATAKLIFRAPQAVESGVVEKAKRLLENSSAKAMALFDGDQVVWLGYKSPADSSKRFLSFSVGKTVTAMAVGKAICEDKLSLQTPLAKVIAELAGSDLGGATVEDLLKMSSGTWQGNPDSTITTTDQDARIRHGAMSLLDLLATRRVNTAQKDADGRSRIPGDYFAYRSTDPLTLGVALNKVTGTSYAKFLEQQVLIPAGISRAAIIGQDRFGYGMADGNVRFYLEDWLRFAVWVKRNERATGCFADYIRRATRTQIANKSKQTGVSFDGYGYLTWTENLKRRDSYWAVGHGGQRIGWNHANSRMLVAFSNVEDYMVDLYTLYAEWAALGDAR